MRYNRLQPMLRIQRANCLLDWQVEGSQRVREILSSNSGEKDPAVLSVDIYIINIGYIIHV